MSGEIPTRQFRKKPFCWQEKTVLRLLRRRHSKRTLPSRRSIYLALTEIESDFGTNPIRNYTKTIATYAGISRQLASRILNEFVRLKLIKIEILRDEKGQFCGRNIYILEYPVSDNPSVDKPPMAYAPHKKVVIYKKINNSKNDFNELKKLRENLLKETNFYQTPQERTKDQELIAGMERAARR